MLDHTDHIELAGIVLDESGYTEMLLNRPKHQVEFKIQRTCKCSGRILALGQFILAL